MYSVRIRQSSPARGPPVPRGDDDRGGYARAEFDALRPASDTSGAAAAAGAATAGALYAMALVHAAAVLYHGTAAFVIVPVAPISPTPGFHFAIAALVFGPGPLLPQSHLAHVCAHTRTSPRLPSIRNEHHPRLHSNV